MSRRTRAIIGGATGTSWTTPSPSASRKNFRSSIPTTWELRSHVSELLASSAPAFGDHIKREMHQSIVEVGTKICAIDRGAGRRDHPHPPRSRRRRRARRAAHRRRRHASVLELDGSGHLARRALREHRRGAAAAGAVAADLRPARPRRGARSRSSMIDLMNEARYFLPHLLALSTSSPFWMGRDTGLKSYRTTVFRRFPRTGIPDHFDSWSEYERLRRACSSSCTASTTARRSGGTCGRSRPSARSSSASATCRPRRAPSIAHRRAGPGDRRQALPPARAATSASAAIIAR